MNEFKVGDEVVNIRLLNEGKPGGIVPMHKVTDINPHGPAIIQLDSKEWVDASKYQLAFNAIMDSASKGFGMRVKDSNPKDAIGIKKAPMSTVPSAVMMEIGLAMLEGACKYGRHNYRAIGVRASVYYDACMRHIMAWWEGEDQDPDSHLSHVTKALACLTVIRDAMINDKWVDDRPPRMKDGWVGQLSDFAKGIIERCPAPRQAYTEKNKNDKV